MEMTKRLGVKLVKQTPGYCGPASVKMVLDYYGAHKSIDELAKLIRTKPEDHPGGSTGESMVVAAKKVGFYGFVKDGATINDIKNYVQKKKMPVILSWFSGYRSHFSVIVKIDKDFIYHFDPEYNTLRKMTFKRLEEVWFEFRNGLRRSNPRLIVHRIIVIFPKSLVN